MTLDQIRTILSLATQGDDGKFVAVTTTGGRIFEGYVWEPDNSQLLRIDSTLSTEGEITYFVDTHSIVTIAVFTKDEGEP
jgi:hypothetical protein